MGEEIRMSYRIKPEHLPCKFAEHGFDSVPVPFGIGNCSMPCFECTYNGDKEIPDDMVCNENNTCPAYEPVATTICPKHDEEYYDYCSKCMGEE